MSDGPRLTTTARAPVPDNQNSVTAGPLGPRNGERIPERWGASGIFTVTRDTGKYTRASVFSKFGKQTDMIACFSTVAGELGAADHERDVRGCALKADPRYDAGVAKRMKVGAPVAQAAE